MADPITFILAAPKALDVAKKIAELLKLVASVDDKLDKLAAVNLNAGMRLLQYAQDSDSDNERINAVRSARDNFIKAIELEKSYRLALAWLGLASCSSWLGDKRNSEAALREILKIDPIAHLSAVQIVHGQVLEHLERQALEQAKNRKSFSYAAVRFVLVFGTIALLIQVFAKEIRVFDVWATKTIGSFTSLAIIGGVVFIWKFRKVIGDWFTASSRRAAYEEGLRRALAGGGDIEKLAQVQKLVAAHLNEIIPWVQAMAPEKAPT